MSTDIQVTSKGTGEQLIKCPGKVGFSPFPRYCWGTGRQQPPLSFLGTAVLDQALAHAAPGGVGNLCSTTSSRFTNWEPTTGPAVLIWAFSLLASLDTTPVPQRTTAKEMTLQHASRFVQIFSMNSFKWPITWRLTPNQAASYMTATARLRIGLLTDGRTSSSSTPGGDMHCCMLTPASVFFGGS